MVRFARAHGSKSSNERQPEEASSWLDLKKQLVTALQSDAQSDAQSEKSTGRNHLAVKKEDMAPEWAEFEEKPIRLSKKVKKEKKIDMKEKDATSLKLCKHGKVNKATKKKKLKEDKKMTKRLGKMMTKLTIFPEADNVGLPSEQITINGAKTDLIATTVKPITLSKRERRKNREANKTSNTFDSVSNADIADGVDLAAASKPPLTKKQLKRRKQLLRKNSDKVDVPAGVAVNAAAKRTATEMEVEGTPTVQLSKRQKRNLKLAAEGVDAALKAGAHKRRKPQLGTKVLINGQEVEIQNFDGFPVLKQDADNLAELRKQMVANGIPEVEIKRTMKLERRKAEKSLAREKKKVCFHCRQSGHNLSECPELGDGNDQDVPGSGICFKCGSTEHTHFECRVNRGQEFRFAKCFICNEQGHISRQCPDNPRGLYPKGGGCKVCGDVTHLKKDCPDLINQKEEQNITLETACGVNLEVLDEDIKKVDDRQIVDVPKNKVVKF